MYNISILAKNLYIVFQKSINNLVVICSLETMLNKICYNFTKIVKVDSLWKMCNNFIKTLERAVVDVLEGNICCMYYGIL